MALFLSTGLAFAGDKINVNTATQAELQTLNGVGESTAAAIIKYRDEMGAFTSLDSLMNVKGIGEKKLAKLADQIVVSVPE